METVTQLETSKSYAKNILYGIFATWALFIALESWAAKNPPESETKPTTEPVKKKSAPAIIKHDDTDIETFEAYSPYAANREMPLPPNTPEDSMRLVDQFQKNYRQCNVMKTKEVMNTVSYVTLHSTEGREEWTIKYLSQTGKAHFMILKNWDIISYWPSSWYTGEPLRQINHMGEAWAEKSRAMRNHDGKATFSAVGIEVSALPWEGRTDAQYSSVKKLLEYLSTKYGLMRKDIITHSMCAYSPEHGLMRKQDPAYLDRQKLWLDPGSAQINRDVVAGIIAPNLLGQYKRLRMQKSSAYENRITLSHEEAIEYMKQHSSWVDDAIKLHKERNNWKINPRAHKWRFSDYWMSIEEIDARYWRKD